MGAPSAEDAGSERIARDRFLAARREYGAAFWGWLQTSPDALTILGEIDIASVMLLELRRLNEAST